MQNYDFPNSTALVVEGGAMRSVFSAGVLDGFLDQEFNPFLLSGSQKKRHADQQ